MAENSLLREIVRDLNIYKGDQESDSQWKWRIIYSAGGRTFLTALWDGMISDEDCVSIQHAKHRALSAAEVLVDAFLNVEVNVMKPAVDAIAEIYVDTGHVYHLQNKYAPSISQSEQLSNVCFRRGIQAYENVRMSGIGPYLLHAREETDIKAIMKLYHIPQMSLKDQFLALTNGIKWREAPLSKDYQFLRTKPIFENGYWVRQPDINMPVSLLKIENEGTPLYMYYKYDGEKLLVDDIPHWRLDKGYFRLANAILAEYGTRPEISFWGDGEITHVYTNYILPYEEDRLFKLYSWPCDLGSCEDPFHRIMEHTVSGAFAVLFKAIGYSVTVRED